jgi:hypothetical protein
MCHCVPLSRCPGGQVSVKSLLSANNDFDFSDVVIHRELRIVKTVRSLRPLSKW